MRMSNAGYSDTKQNPEKKNNENTAGTPLRWFTYVLHGKNSQLPKKFLLSELITWWSKARKYKEAFCSGHLMLSWLVTLRFTVSMFKCSQGHDSKAVTFFIRSPELSNLQLKCWCWVLRQITIMMWYKIL